jgi:hypothetical protein
MIQYIYPRLYSLHDMPETAGLPDPTTGAIALPPPLNLTSANVVPFGLYLIDDGQTQFLWLGRDAVPALVMDVFGTDDKNIVPRAAVVSWCPRYILCARTATRVLGSGLKVFSSRTVPTWLSALLNSLAC